VLDRVKNEFVQWLGTHLRELVFLGIFAILGLFLVRALLRFLARGLRRSRLGGAAGDFMVSVARVLLWTLYVIILLTTLGVPTTGLLAMLSAFALAISLALQSTFSNVAAGIILVMTKPFAEGDFVQIGEVSGEVETITVFNTKLKTPDNKVIVLPNGTVTVGNIVNYNAKAIRRLALDFSVGYGTDVTAVRRTVLAHVENYPLILRDPAPVVVVTDLGESALQISLRVWLPTNAFWDVKFALAEGVYHALLAAGIEIPYAQLDVHIK